MSNDFSKLFIIKYFRSYPYFLQLLLFMLLEFIVLSFTYVITVLVSAHWHINAKDIANLNQNSPRQIIDGALLLQLIGSIGLFMLPALLFTYLATPGPANYLGLNRPGRSIHWFIVTCMWLGAIPVFLWIGSIPSQIDFGSQIKAAQAVNDHTTEAFTNMPNVSAFLKILFIMAIVPAIGEELFFRGILMRFSKKKSRTMAFPLIFSALVFTLSHTNYNGFASIFLAGILLGITYYLTGSLWCSMLGHFLNNGLQIIIIYLANDNKTIVTIMSGNSLPPSIVITGAALFAVSFYFLLKTKTPMPANWADDFAADVPAISQNE